MHLSKEFAIKNDLTKQYDFENIDFIKNMVSNEEDIDYFLQKLKEIYEDDQKIINDERDIAFENIEKIRIELKKYVSPFDNFLQNVKEMYKNYQNITDDEKQIAFETIEKIKMEFKKK